MPSRTHPAEFDETLELIEGGGATQLFGHITGRSSSLGLGKHPKEKGRPGTEADFYLPASTGERAVNTTGYKQYDHQLYKARLQAGP